MNLQSTRLVQSISANAGNDPDLVGIFDPTTILTFVTGLITVLKGLFSGGICNPTSTLPSPEMLTGKLNDPRVYDPQTETYDSRTMAVAIRNAKQVAIANSKAAGHHRKDKLNYDQAHAMAIHTLDGVRTSAPEVLQEAIDAS